MTYYNFTDPSQNALLWIADCGHPLIQIKRYAEIDGLDGPAWNLDLTWKSNPISYIHSGTGGDAVERCDSREVVQDFEQELERLTEDDSRFVIESVASSCAFLQQQRKKASKGIIYHLESEENMHQMTRNYKTSSALSLHDEVEMAKEIVKRAQELGCGISFALNFKHPQAVSILRKFQPLEVYGSDMGGVNHATACEG